MQRKSALLNAKVTLCRMNIIKEWRYVEKNSWEKVDTVHVSNIESVSNACYIFKIIVQYCHGCS